jgi:hypothetical protein
VTPDEFRAIALKLPDVVEGAHMNHPDFRAGKKVFATLGYPNTDYGMVKLKPEQQEVLIAAEPEVFSAAKGAWGRQGSTLVNLRKLNRKTAMSALQMAWKNVAK